MERKQDVFFSDAFRFGEVRRPDTRASACHPSVHWNRGSEKTSAGVVTGRSALLT